MRFRRLLAVVVALALGVGLGQGLNLVTAQESEDTRGSEASAWEIYHGPMSDQSDNAFYVIKHNRATGETLVLSVIDTADDDSWYRLPIKGVGTDGN